MENKAIVFIDSEVKKKIIKLRILVQSMNRGNNFIQRICLLLLNFYKGILTSADIILFIMI